MANSQQQNQSANSENNARQQQQDRGAASDYSPRENAQTGDRSGKSAADPGNVSGTQNGGEVSDQQRNPSAADKDSTSGRPDHQGLTEQSGKTSAD